MLSDSELANGCLKLERSAQKELYQRYVKKMNAVCRRYVSDTDEAKDILQDGFIKVFENIGKYRNEGPLEAWVRRIIVNTTLSKLRKIKSGVFVSGEVSEINEVKYSSEDSMEGDENSEIPDYSKEEIEFAIDQLNDHYKIIFNLYCIENYSHKEISDLLQIKEESSRTRLNRARKMLQENLREIHKNNIRLKTTT